ncbi:DLW-39 family protein [Actinomyces sp. F1_1611]
MKKFLVRASVVAACAAGAVLIWQTIRDLSTAEELWHPITDPVE